MSCALLGGSWVADGMRISWALLLDWIGQMWELVWAWIGVWTRLVLAWEWEFIPHLAIWIPMDFSLDFNLIFIFVIRY